MTDNEIVKALELCNSTEIGHCLNKCPYYDYSANCTQAMLKDTLDLLGRQKAEIERVKKDNEELGKIIGQAAELNCFLEASRKCVRNEAIKEFAERVNECKEINPDSVDGELIIYAQDFDHIVKEMTEVSENDRA